MADRQRGRSMRVAEPTPVMRSCATLTRPMKEAWFRAAAVKWNVHRRSVRSRQGGRAVEDRLELRLCLPKRGRSGFEPQREKEALRTVEPGSMKRFGPERESVDWRWVGGKRASRSGSAEPNCTDRADPVGRCSSQPSRGAINRLRRIVTSVSWRYSCAILCATKRSAVRHPTGSFRRLIADDAGRA